MPLTARPFAGANFFYDIRGAMDGNRAMFAGRDGNLKYVCLDAVFYRLESTIRPNNAMFTDHAQSLPSSVRVVVSGQTFPTYCAPLFPCSVDWQGEVYAAGVRPRPGDPPSVPDRHHFGQTFGRGEPSIVAGLGDLSPRVPAVRDGIGKLIPLLDAKVKATTGQLRKWAEFPASKGKVAYGIHRDAQIVFVLGQQHGDATMRAVELVDLLASMGVDDAAFGDGSDSATLVVDGNVEVVPNHFGYKNPSIPNGLAFRLQSLSLAPGAALRKRADTTTDPQFPDAAVTGTSGNVRATNAGVTIEITSFGSAPGFNAGAIAALLEIALPMSITCPSSSLVTGQPISYPGVVGQVFFHPSATNGGTITGYMLVTNSRGSVGLDIDWPLAT